jgi:hypothetical protein
MNLAQLAKIPNETPTCPRVKSGSSVGNARTGSAALLGIGLRVLTVTSTGCCTVPVG